MAYAGPHMWMKANEDSFSVLQMLYDNPAGMPFSTIKVQLSFDKSHLLKLLLNLKEYNLVETFRPIPNKGRKWRIPANSFAAVSKILMLVGSKTTSKMVAEVA